MHVVRHPTSNSSAGASSSQRELRKADSTSKRLSFCLNPRSEPRTVTTQQAVVHSDPKILGGTPVFVGTRVPVQSLFDYLEAGDSLERFLEQFPTVSREQAHGAL